MRALATYGQLGSYNALITMITPSGGTEKSWEKHVYFSAVPNRRMDSSLYSPGAVTPTALPDLERDSFRLNRQKVDKGKSRENDREDIPADPTPKHCRWVGEFSTNGTKRPEAIIYQTPWGGYLDENLEQSFYANNRSTPTPGSETLHGSNDSTRTTWLTSTDEPQYELNIPINQGRVSNLRNKDSVLTPCNAFIQGGLEGFPAGSLPFKTRLMTSQGFFQLWLKDMATNQKEDLETRIHQFRSCTTGLVPLEDAVRNLESAVDPLLLWQYFEGPDPYQPDEYIKAFFELIKSERSMCETTLIPLRNLAFATSIYETLENATISTRLVDTGLADAKWAAYDTCVAPTIPQVLCCIAMLETGVVNLKPNAMENVLGVCSGNSMFVLSRLLVDPSVQANRPSVTRLVGNVGRPGISLLVPPAAGPLVRPLSSSYHAVSYAPFDGKWEDNFSETTLHLSFTKHEFPVDYGVSGIMDHQVYFVESVISVHDRGKWVADLDVLGAFEQDAIPLLPQVYKRRSRVNCNHSESLLAEAAENLASLDTWEEVLDMPPHIGIIRAHKNWAARLAVAVILAHKQKPSEVDVNKTTRIPQPAVLAKPENFAVLADFNHVCSVCLYRRIKQWRKNGTDGDAPFYLIA